MRLLFVKEKITRCVCWILLLQMINISIDMPCIWQFRNINATQEKGRSINDIQTIYELIAEGVFDEDVPESGENNIDTKSETFDLYCYTNTYSKLLVFNLPIEHDGYYCNNLSFESPEPNSPPPKYI